MNKANLTAEKAKYADLLKQNDRMHEKTGTFQAELNDLSHKKIELKKEYQQLEKQFICDEITAKELEAKQAEVDAVNEKLSTLERLHQLAITTLAEIDAEILATRRNIQALHCEYCLNVKSDILNTLSSDAKIRSKLIEAYVSMKASGGGYSTDWGQFVTAVFNSRPSQSEIDQAYSKFIADHGLDDPHSR